MISVAALALVLLALGFVPLVGGLRYEAALAAGLIVPSWVGIYCSQIVWRRLRGAARKTESDGVTRTVPLQGLLGSAMAMGLLHFAAAALVGLLHSVRVGFCEPGLGFLTLVLGPGLGALLAGVAGACVALGLCSTGFKNELLGRLALVLLTLAFPWGSAALEVLSFLNTPVVYAYDPFAGYFAGPLYDTVEYDLERFVVFRVGTVCTLAAVLAWSTLFALRFESEKVRVVRRGQDSSLHGLGWFALGLSFLLGSFWHSAQSHELGLSTTAQSLQQQMGRRTDQGPCSVYFSSGVTAHQARTIAKECVGHLGQLSTFFEVESPGRVHVYLFEDAAEKKRLMGAGRTKIAKPWRKEIYIQPQGFPHPILGHELAHVMTAEFGVGPMKIAGPLGGWMVDPGRVEGFAEAASPREASEGTLQEWTAAMKELKQLPRLQSLFQLSFWGNSAARSYTAAGSFVAFIRETHGSSVLKQWYAGADLPELAGASWEELEQAWLDHLAGVTVPEAVLEIARPKFSRPGVFERRCPHAVDRTLGEALTSCKSQEAKARRLVGEAIALDPARIDWELQLPRCADAAGETERAQEELKKLIRESERYDVAPRRRAWDYLGDTYFRQGKRKAAKAAYQGARKLAFARDVQRQLDVKLWALSQPEDVAEPLRMLLAPAPQGNESPLLRLSQWFYSSKKKSLPAYLLTRQALATGRTKDARELWKSVDVQKLEIASVKREAARMAVLVSCRGVMENLTKEDAVQEALADYERLGWTASEKLEAQRIAERCLNPEIRK